MLEIVYEILEIAKNRKMNVYDRIQFGEWTLRRGTARHGTPIIREEVNYHCMA